jgi:DNA-binding transcriptional ArsR family regulator
MDRIYPNIFKALSDSTRLKILRKIARKGEVACKDISRYFSLSQPTLSHHFNKLIDANIINSRKDGTSVFYSVNRKYLKKIGINIDKILK